jgi:cystathionine gamma-lyase/homocysteine desulfhydrase
MIKNLPHRSYAVQNISNLQKVLGGVKSLICLPCEMTHKSIPSEIRYQSGVTDSLIRLSVGLEDVEDLISDLQTAFQVVTKKISLTY